VSQGYVLKKGAGVSDVIRIKFKMQEELPKSSLTVVRERVLDEVDCLSVHRF